MSEADDQAMIRYRLERADEALKEASILLGQGMLRGTINRAIIQCSIRKAIDLQKLDG
jgi:hypothetical protein